MSSRGESPGKGSCESITFRAWINEGAGERETVSPVENLSQLNPGGIDLGPGELHVQGLERLEHDLRHREIPEPLLVRGNDVPGCLLRAAARERVLVRRLVSAPVFPLREIRLGKLPPLPLVLEALEQAPFLFRLADVKIELEDRDVVLGEVPLEGVDLLVAVLPYGAGNEIVHPHDDHVLVMGPVEDPEL